MSFGFSVGDFLATARLISSIVDALQKSSVSEFKELTLELHAVQRALNEIEHIQPSPGQEQSINAIKVVALLCQHPLQEFAGKLEKYESLGQVAGTKTDQIKRWKLKLQWGFTMEEEVQKIRTILAAHMASLNVHAPRAPVSLQMSKQNLSRTSNSIAARKFDALHNDLAHTHNTILEIEKATTSQQAASRQSDTFLQTLLSLMLRAIISARFSSGPGHKKVHAGEYEIFNTSDTTQVLSECDLQSLIPGMKITMAFVIGRYQHRTLEECPKPDCKARKFARKSTGGRICSTCGVWFDVSKDTLPRPFRLDLTEGSFHRLRTERKWFKNVKICPSNIPSVPPCVDDQGFWIEAPTISESIDERRIQETLCNTSISPQKDAEDQGYLIIQANVAAEIIRGIAEDLYLTVAELKDIAANDSEPGRLGIDSLMAVSISWRLKSLNVAPPRGVMAQNFYDGLFLESLIRDLVKIFGLWSCVSES
ncbi:MAG: hypothetical protein Q9199_007812 [Rusavskia elegans]